MLLFTCIFRLPCRLLPNRVVGLIGHYAIPWPCRNGETCLEPSQWLCAFLTVLRGAGVKASPATPKNRLFGTETSFEIICRFRIDASYRLPLMSI
jgi:hypothetical protein